MKCTLCGREGTKGFITGAFDDDGNYHEITRCASYKACTQRIATAQKIEKGRAMANFEELHAPFSQQLAMACQQIENNFIEALVGMISDYRDTAHEQSHEFAKTNRDDEKCVAFSVAICTGLNIWDTGIHLLVETRNKAIKDAFQKAEAERN